MSTHKLHIVQKGETLQSIAEKYHISVEALRRYHNTYCELSDLIEEKLTHHKKIFIPQVVPENTNENIATTTVKKPILSYAPHHCRYQYGVTITIEEAGKKDELKYEVGVKWVQKYEEYHIFEIDRNSKIYINEEETNLIADVLAYKTSKVLYPMHILVSDKAELVDIATYNKYRERWKTVKEEVLKEFTGEVVTSYLKKIEDVLKEPSLLMLYLSGDFFLRTLFLGYSENFTQNNIFEKDIHYPIVENAKEPNYKAQLKLAETLDEYNLLHIEIKGSLDDKRSKEDFINGYLFPNEEEGVIGTKSEGQLYGSYFLNPNNGMPEALQLEVSIGLATEKKVTVMIANTVDEKIILRDPKNRVYQEQNTTWVSIKDKLK